MELLFVVYRDVEELYSVAGVEVARILLVDGVVPVFKNAKALQGLPRAIGVVDGARARCAGLSGLEKVGVGVIYIGHVWKLRDEEVIGYGVDSHGIETAEKRAWPCAVEGGHCPGASRFAIDTSRPVQSVDKPYQAFASQVFMPHKIDKCDVFGVALPVLIEIVVKVFSPIGV